MIMILRDFWQRALSPTTAATDRLSRRWKTADHGTSGRFVNGLIHFASAAASRTNQDPAGLSFDWLTT